MVHQTRQEKRGAPLNEKERKSVGRWWWHAYGDGDTGQMYILECTRIGPDHPDRPVTIPAPGHVTDDLPYLCSWDHDPKQAERDLAWEHWDSGESADVMASKDGHRRNRHKGEWSTCEVRTCKRVREGAKT